EELAEENDIDYVLTAHQADDALETFLINMSRGTGIRGLAGIPHRQGRILRPLLIFSRAQILDYARENNINWCEDSSNKEVYYLRNKIRHELVPKLKELHPAFLENFKTTQSHLRASVSLLDHQVKELKSTLFVKENDHWKIPIESINKMRPKAHYLYELFREYGFSEWDNVLDLLQASSGKELTSKTHRLIKDRDHLLLAGKRELSPMNFEFDLQTGEILVPVTLKIEQINSMGECSNSILYVDKETLNHRLEIRKWKKGDYFYPLGMKGRKLVSKYFKDEKMNALEKEAQWLLFSGGRLVWIIGRRADDRFKITPSTKKIFKFSLIR
ncbi:MAG: tRNA lysidine(34) synthetase TilS, partial [Flavobacteriaceae bacterium]